jgi:hypothetical protein
MSGRSGGMSGLAVGNVDWLPAFACCDRRRLGAGRAASQNAAAHRNNKTHISDPPPPAGYIFD